MKVLTVCSPTPPSGRGHRYSPQHVLQCIQEAQVLLRSAVGDTQGSLASQSPTAAHEHPALEQSAHDLAFLPPLAEVHPAEIGLGVGDTEVQRQQSLLHRDALGDRAWD